MGVPEDSVAAIMIYHGETPEIVKREENGDVFYSLPHFFDLADRTVRHGIVLKPSSQLRLRGQDEVSPAFSPEEEGPRNVLLVSAVERETDIPPEEIFPLPEILTAPDRISFFTGIWFTGQAMIAFIDPVLLITRILGNTEGEPAE
jgi:hypothetical protein